jgi:hypothetical protein
VKKIKLGLACVLSFSWVAPMRTILKRSCMICVLWCWKRLSSEWLLELDLELILEVLQALSCARCSTTNPL